MTRHLIVALVLALVAALGYRGRPAASAAPPTIPMAPASVATPNAAALEPPALAAIGFRDAAHLAEHFQKHGAELGVHSAEEYLLLAQQLRDRHAGGAILEAARHDRTVTRFDRTTGAFLAFDPDGIIRTFFRPNDGEAYFRRQLTREPSHP